MIVGCWRRVGSGRNSRDAEEKKMWFLAKAVFNALMVVITLVGLVAMSGFELVATRWL
jgi:hypothetical protein